MGTSSLGVASLSRAEGLNATCGGVTASDASEALGAPSRSADLPRFHVGYAMIAWEFRLWLFTASTTAV
ncbi:MAG: hypothetical protein JKY37_06875 [Nannocystaceae bacterium]|nr:hypothetical protein [Nannocystaceae bacterium]